MNTRPKNPANARNLNACVIGSSGSGKTRFWLTPQLLQAHSSYVVVDPKGDVYKRQEVFRVPEYTRNGETALTRTVKYSDGTCLDGESKGDLLDGTPGQDATDTGYHWTKAVCEVCGTINSNMGATSYACNKNVYWLYDLSLIHIFKS